MTINHIAIIGAGQMGCGIAHVCVQNGYTVVLMDMAQSQVDNAQNTINKNLKRQEKSGIVLAHDTPDILARLTYTTDISTCANSDLIIEAATEDIAVKGQILKSITPYLKPHAIVVSNTSSLSITALAAHTDRPHKFMGLHFMNPVPMMKLIELIRGFETDDATFNTISVLVKTLQKVQVISKDYPGFIVNRLLMPMINEAIFAVFEGIATPEGIDTAMKLGTNHPMGPLELADLIGLDTCLSILTILYDGCKDPKYRPCPLLVKYVEAGWLGRKTERGFYDTKT